MISPLPLYVPIKPPIEGVGWIIANRGHFVPWRGLHYIVECIVSEGQIANSPLKIKTNNLIHPFQKVLFLLQFETGNGIKWWGTCAYIKWRWQEANKEHMYPHVCLLKSRILKILVKTRHRNDEAYSGLKKLIFILS